MNFHRSALALGLALAAGAVQAAGPLYTTDTNPPRPYTWNMASGPIPVYTDGGGAFTYNTDGTVFLSIERADEITAFAFKQWTDVPTSTFAAQLAGKYKDVLGIEDITGANAAEVYEKENGYGFWVNYDTDGSILEQYFGVSKSSVLGIAFPEYADAEGNITEATAVLNGWFVHVKDTQGNMVAGVFTHEFGHALNMSHTQVNGHMAYFSTTFAPKYPGVKGCVDPIYRWDSSVSTTPRMDPAAIETMYPFLNTTTLRAGDNKNAGQEQSTVNMPDDVAAISNLYPTADYLASRGAISGVLYLKDGKTPYSGINVIARNVADPVWDAVSAMTGDQTQGKVGPDGHYTINNLTPGKEYVVYIEEIYAGGFPTTPQRLISQAEYWDAGESTDPASDLPCNATPIRAEAGVTKQADIYFNGYMNGVDFVPVVSAFLTDLSKDGKKSAGLSGATSFIWDKNKGFYVQPAAIKATNASMTRNAQSLLVNYDVDGNGINQMALYQWANNTIAPLGDLNGDTCGGSSTSGKSSSYGWAVDDSGKTAVGTGYIDKDGNGICQQSFKGEIVPVVWNAQGGMKELDWSSLPVTSTQYVRAHAISGNGRVILGAAPSGQKAVAWVDQGPLVNLNAMFGARDVYAANYDGTKVAFQSYVPSGSSTKPDEVVIWNPFAPAGTAPRVIGSLRWCTDLPYIDRLGRDLCATLGADGVYAQYGTVPVLLTDMTDDGGIVIGRAGSSSAGYLGVMWIDGIGWLKWNEFFRKQGVAEAYAVPFDNPISMSASGSEVVGGIPGVSFSWWANLDQVFVCERGKSVQVGFPNGLRAKVAKGAVIGRCEHL